MSGVRPRTVQEREQERKLIETYINEGIIKLSSLSTVEPFMRKVLLSWIGKSMASKNRKVKTDYGLVVQVELDQNQTITLKAEDGDLIMPDATFLFEEQR